MAKHLIVHENLLIVGVCDANFKLFALNWLESLKRVSLLDYVRLVCLDDELYDSIDFPGKMRIPEIEVTKHEHLFHAKVHAAHHFLKQGYDVLIVDMDVVFLKDPLPAILPLIDQYDVIGQDTKMPTPGEPVNTGFYFLKCCEATVNLTDLSNDDDLIEIMGYEDQKILNYKLINQNVRFMTLDQSEFPTGRYLRIAEPKNAYIIHFSCCGPHKIRAMRQYNCWFMDKTADEGVRIGIQRTQRERRRRALLKRGGRPRRRRRPVLQTALIPGAPPLATIPQSNANLRWELIVEAAELADLNVARYAEIGVFRGGNFKYILRRYPIAQHYLIDPWDAYEEYVQSKTAMGIPHEKGLYEKAYAIVMRMFGNRDNVHIIREHASKAVDKIPDDMDIIFIDGNHEYSYVKQDIENYLPKVRPGGILCGHDYGLYKSGVKKAVDEVLGEDVFLANCMMWFHHKQ